MQHPLFFLLLVSFLLQIEQLRRPSFFAAAFSTPTVGSLLGEGGGDRFRATCPCDPTSIHQFDAGLLEKNNDAIGETWVAVYRSNHNQPSVFVRDDFFDAMKEATTETNSDDDATPSTQSASAQQTTETNDLMETPLSLAKPVAVARLRPSPEFDGKFVLDQMRCSLKKEDLDESCDGGSEFLEALSVAIDSLLLYHLQEQQQQQQQKSGSSGDDDSKSSTTTFGGSIRTKATLFSHKLLEDRGFAPVESLSKDMASHFSSYENCLQKYAERSVSGGIKLGARDRALQILGLLGSSQDEQEESGQGFESDGDSEDGGDSSENDPWANVKMQI